MALTAYEYEQLLLYAKQGMFEAGTNLTTSDYDAMAAAISATVGDTTETIGNVVKLDVLSDSSDSDSVRFVATDGSETKTGTSEG